MSTGLRFAEQAVAASVADAPGTLKALRTAGAEAFKSLGFPTTREEDWHYTNVSAIASAQFEVAVDRAPVGAVTAATLAPYTFGGTWPLVVFVNGRFDAALSSLDTLPDGVRVMSLTQAAEDEPELLSRFLGTAVTPSRDGFSALNAAFAGEGMLVHIAKEMVSDTPVHILHLVDAAGANVMSHPRHLLVTERHAKASVVESYIGLADVPYFTNAVVEAFVEDGATLQLVRIQRESRSAQHVSTVEARQDATAISSRSPSRPVRRCRAATCTRSWPARDAAARSTASYMLDGSSTATIRRAWSTWRELLQP